MGRHQEGENALSIGNTVAHGRTGWRPWCGIDSLVPALVQ